MSVLRNLIPKLAFFTPILGQTISKNFHSLCKPTILNVSNLLVPTSITVQQNCGFKVKGQLRKRCKDCYFVRREDRLYVICDKHPRHKQMAMTKDPRSKLILSHATMGKVRPW